ncbi:hypothetical protein OROHE_010993 [Orobanche hederae]
MHIPSLLLINKMDSQVQEDMHSYTYLLQQGSDVPLESSPLFSQLSPDQAGGPRQRRGNNFNVYEDKLLESAWLNTSLDPITGTDIKSGGFWKKVENYYVEAKELEWPPRSSSSLSHRWSNIQHAVNKFCGCLSQIERMHRSGVSKEDNIQDARKMFQELNKQPFRYDHCWDLLKFEQKWIQRSDNVVPPKRKAPLPCTSSHEPIDLSEDTHEVNETNNEIPIGRKAAKDRKKSSKCGIKDFKVLSNAFLEMKNEKRKNHEDRMMKYDTSCEQRVKLLEIQEAQLLAMNEGNRIKSEKLKLEQNKADEEIMMKDTSSMNLVQQEYF